MSREVINATIVIDTVYGFINKVGACRAVAFNNRQVLESYLDRVFIGLKTAILQEFDNMENQNKIEVDDE